MTNIKFPETDLIGCRFPQVTGRNGELVYDKHSKEYVYRVLPGMTRPEIGSVVVVSCTTGFQVAVVTSLNCTVPSTWNKGEIANLVGVVDFATYAESIEKQKQKELIKKELMKKKKELDDQFALQLYAEKSPEFKELLDLYNSL